MNTQLSRYVPASAGFPADKAAMLEGTIKGTHVFKAGVPVKLPHIQGVTGGTDQTSGECSLGRTMPI
jgi:hypothetical protein